MDITLAVILLVQSQGKVKPFLDKNGKTIKGSILQKAYIEINGVKMGMIIKSKNTALANFSCDQNNLTTLDASNNIALKKLYCNNNELTTLYSTTDTWETPEYRPQYTDSTHTTTKDNLTITIKK